MLGSFRLRGCYCAVHVATLLYLSPYMPYAAICSTLTHLVLSTVNSQQSSVMLLSTVNSQQSSAMLCLSVDLSKALSLLQLPRHLLLRLPKHHCCCGWQSAINNNINNNDMRYACVDTHDTPGKNVMSRATPMDESHDYLWGERRDKRHFCRSLRQANWL